jgi:hypothetical protein
VTLTAATATESTWRVTRVRYQRDPAMDNLRDAIDWLEERWGEQRQAPIRLHAAHSTEGALGAPSFTGAFAAHLDWTPRTVVRWRMTASCAHPLTDGNSRRCPECSGLGIKEIAADRYPYPMTVALNLLARLPRHREQPHPAELVASIAQRDWNARAVAEHYGLPWEQAEPLLLRAIRKLHSRYRAGPMAVSWVDKSESQQAAEGTG